MYDEQEQMFLISCMYVPGRIYAALRLNGLPCKRPENVTAGDFFSGLLANPGNTGNGWVQR